MGSHHSIGTWIQTRNGVTRLTLSGELDMATALTLNTALESVERDGGGSIVIDLRELTFIDSSGLHALVRAHDRSISNGHRLLLIGATEQTRRLFEIVGIDHLLEDEGTAELLGRFARIDAAGQGGRPRG